MLGEADSFQVHINSQLFIYRINKWNEWMNEWILISAYIMFYKFIIIIIIIQEFHGDTSLKQNFMAAAPPQLTSMQHGDSRD